MVKYFDSISSPIGKIKIYASDTGITKIDFDDNILAEPNSNHHTERAKTQLSAYFEGELTTFDIPLDFEEATQFQVAVWNELCKIPFGSTVSYQRIADKLNNPKAVRAVGLANGKNRIPIVVPCHRVIGSDGSLTGFAWGLDIKRKLLLHEQKDKYGEQLIFF